MIQRDAVVIRWRGSFKLSDLYDPECTGTLSGQELEINLAEQGSSPAVTQSSVQVFLDSSAGLAVYSWAHLFVL